MGRYITLTKDFLNHSQLTMRNNHMDLKRMGLLYDKTSHTFGTKSDMAELAYSFPDGIRVLKLKADDEIDNSYGHVSRAQHKDGGWDYWFNSPNDGDFMCLNIKETSAKLVSIPEDADKEKLRHYVQVFLNEGIGNPPPPGRDEIGASNRNFLGVLHLFYDYIVKKYGYAEEVSELAMEAAGFKIYLRGSSQHSKEFQLYENGEEVADISLDGDSLRMPNYLTDSSDKLGDAPEFSRILDVMTALDMPPEFNPLWGRSDFMDRYHCVIYWNDRKYGLLEQVGTKLWHREQFALYKWDNARSGHEVYTMTLANIPIFDIQRDEHPNLKPCDGCPSGKALTKLLINCLNTCKGLAWLVESDYDFDEQDVYFSETTKKWGSREKVGKLYHKFDDGYYYMTFPRGEKNIVYTLYDPSNNPVIGFDIYQGVHVQRHHTYSNGVPMSASRHVLWLLNESNFSGEDVVDGGSKGYYNSDVVRGGRCSCGSLAASTTIAPSNGNSFKMAS
jgi:hypothetical protein